MHSRFKRAVAGGAALTAAATALLASGAQALPPGTPPNAPAEVTPPTGNSSTDMVVKPPTGAACPGDSATNGYLWSTFIVDGDIDVATLQWDSNGPVPPVAGDIAFPLLTPGGSFVNGNTTDIGTGLILSVPAIDFSQWPAGFFPAGSYKVGVACHQGAAVTAAYWSQQMNITATPGANGGAEFTYTTGTPASAPGAPTGVVATPASGQVSVAFTAVTATPAVTSYTVTATPQGGGAAVTATGASSPIVVPGLTNGTTYDIVVSATNSVGTGPNSSPAVSATPNAGAQPAPTAFVAVPGAASGDLDLSWTAPAGLAPVGYSLVVAPVDPADPTVPGSPFTLPSSPTSFTVSGLPAGVLYGFQLTPQYADPSAVATPATVQAAAAGAQTLQQEIRVERPAGALILTQRCGVNNALAAEPAVPGFPGFPAVAAIAATADQTGTSPDIDPSTPAVEPDPEFGNYPFPSPATYPTKCVIDLGTAELITTGDLAGQYYAADGALNEVTVVDLRQGDNGWTVSGSISSLSNGGTNPDDSFTGNLVGWTPVVSEDTDPTGASPYDQIVTAGAAVVPGTANGLANPAGQVLASADPGEGLGVAVLDARVKVLIPVSNASGTYSGVLNLNAS